MSFNVPTDFASRPVAVIGAGTLGRRIALMFAAHGPRRRTRHRRALLRRTPRISRRTPQATAFLPGAGPSGR
jgi:hypothetical protein